MKTFMLPKTMSGAGLLFRLRSLFFVDAFLVKSKTTAQDPGQHKFDWLKFYLYISLLPLCKIVFNVATDTLGYNAIQALHFELGTWALRFLCITLLITPIQLIMKWQGMTPYRQLFGLLTFFYATLHVLGYLIVDHALHWPNIAVDIIESSYLWFGLLAYIIIFMLAITTPVAMKKLLGKKWKKLHRYIYIAAIASLIHYFWQLKGNLAEPLFYSLIVSLELIFRILNWLKNRKLALLMIPNRRFIKDD